MEELVCKKCGKPGKERNIKSYWVEDTNRENPKVLLSRIVCDSCWLGFIKHIKEEFAKEVEKNEL